MDTLVILGTARDDSNTLEAVKELCPFQEYDLIQLHQLDIQKYKYDAQPLVDDFFGIADRMARAQNIVFATPVYWYSMSGELKVFFDRLTDLITINKTLGRKLMGKHVYLIATGAESTMPVGFTEPFEKTAEYFDMTFEASFYKRCDG